MKVETKYDIGDTLWTVDSDKVTAFKVNTICVAVTDLCMGEGGFAAVSYCGAAANKAHKEKECFRTKSELINWLADPYGAGKDKDSCKRKSK